MKHFNTILHFYVRPLNLFCLLKIIVVLQIYVTLCYPFCLKVMFKSKLLYGYCIMYVLLI